MGQNATSGVRGTFTFQETAMKRHLGLLAFAPLALLALAGCSDDDGADDAALDATAGSCTVEDMGDGTSEIRCPDGSKVTIDNGRTGAPGRDGAKGKDGLDGANGKDGKDGKDVESPCVLTENGDGTHSLTCGDKSVVIGAPCDSGFPFPVIVTNPDDQASSLLTLFQVTTCTWIRGDVLIDDYDREELPAALARIEKIDGDLVVGSNESLLQVSFPVLKTVAGEVTVEANESLLQVSLPALETVGGNLFVANNPSLTATSFPALESVSEGLVWVNNESLESVGEFPELVGVRGLVWMTNPKLAKTPAFPKLAEIGWTLMWDDNAALTETLDFPALESVGLGEAPDEDDVPHGIIWFGNAALEKTGNFPALVTVAGELAWVQNESLVSTGDFALLETMDGTLVVGANGALETLGSFESLTSLDVLYVEDNDKLTALPDFSALTSVGGVTVQNNAELTSVEGLSSIAVVERDFYVRNNAKLPICDVVSVIEAIQTVDGIGGVIDYSGNDETDTSCLVN